MLAGWRQGDRRDAGLTLWQPWRSARSCFSTRRFADEGLNSSGPCAQSRPPLGSIARPATITERPVVDARHGRIHDGNDLRPRAWSTSADGCARTRDGTTATVVEGASTDS